MTQIIIIEDSSIYDLGGGQRITLEAISCLKGKAENNILLYDLGSGLQFKEQVFRYKIFSRFFGIKNIPHYFYKIPEIIIEILKSTSLKETFFLYPTTKKALIVSVLIKLINKKSLIIFHQHSNLGFMFNLLKIFVRTVIIPGKIDERYNKKTVVLQNPVNVIKTKFQCKAQNNNKIIIGFIGGLTQHKGFDVFAAAQNINKQPALVAGRGPLENIIKKSIHLEYLGYLDGQKKQDFYRKIDILVFPSRVEETFSLVCFEAMFNFNPIVCFDIGYPSKIVKKYGVGVVAKSITASALNIAIQECIESIHVLSGNCKKVIEEFENDKFCHDLLSIFK